MYPLTTSAAEDISRLIELFRCAYKTGKTFDFPKPPYWPSGGTLADNFKVNNTNVGVFVDFKEDIIACTPKRVSYEIKNSDAWFYFDKFTIKAAGSQATLFTEYLYGDKNYESD